VSGRPAGAPGTPPLLSRFLARTEFASYEEFFAQYRVDVPEGFNFAYDVVDELAARSPEARALVWCDPAGREASFTFAEVKAWSDRAANLFAAAGVGKGDAVMLVLKRRVEFWFALLGLHKLGAVAIPATHLLRAKDIVYRVDAADVRMIVSVDEPEIVAQIEAATVHTPGLRAKALVGGRRDGWLDFRRALERAPAAFARPAGTAAAGGADPMLIYFTSGTTGLPKMVLHDFTYPLGHLLTARYWQNLSEGGLHLTVADTGWAKAAWGKIYGQWLCGCAVFVYDMDSFVPGPLLDALVRHRVSSFCAPPTVFRYLIKEDLAARDFSALRWCTVAGEPLNPEVYQKWLAATGVPLMEGYGQTELVVVAATWPWLEPKPGSMGKPAPGWGVDLVSESGLPVEVGEEGQIVVRTGSGRPAGMFRGYHRDEAMTARVWHDGLYHTGDMAWRDEDGYLWFVGRADDVIKSSGYRIGPFEVESALLEHPAVLECAVTAVPDADRGQVVKATVVLSGGRTGSPQLARELQDHVKRVTAPYKYPRVVEFVAELPKTISGKIRRVEIRDRDR
jgi:acetyl-CoA synthetase